MTTTATAINNVTKELHIRYQKLVNSGPKNMKKNMSSEQFYTTYMCMYAATKSVECLQITHEHGCPWDENTCESAASNTLECLQYVHEHGCPWDKETCESAATTGNLRCLTYAHENGCPWDEATCIVAATYGNIACLKYAHENGCPCPPNLCYSIATKIKGSDDAVYRRNIISCLEYARTVIGADWDAAVCAGAAKFGHTWILQYAHEHGCPWDINTCKVAIDNNNLECLKYAQIHDCPCSHETYRKIINKLMEYQYGHHNCTCNYCSIQKNMCK